ncbi:hypothetical protein [Mycoplana sp. BE70]|uniref:hypothetical protein n=1 Tax=Mycoplana sp. BE70 TaxID=2817775 RepID=UPI00286D3F21|nr:hypothetical protein [Mycoplana sp. BE70]
MRENITSGDIPFRKATIQAVVDEVEDKPVRIIGKRGHYPLGNGWWPAVGSSEEKWRTRRDSNS